MAAGLLLLALLAGPSLALPLAKPLPLPPPPLPIMPLTGLDPKLLGAPGLFNLQAK
jgi:hypothetical protein